MNYYLEVLSRKKAATGGGGGTIMNEDFEGTGTPSNWLPNVGSPNFDSTTSPLNGAQSLRLPAGSSVGYPSSPKLNLTELYGKCKVKISNLPVGGTDRLIYVRDDTFQKVLEIDINTDGTLLCDAAVIFGNTASAMSAGTIYDVWVYIKPGTTGSASVAFATTGSSRPTSGSNFFGGTGNTIQTGLVVDFILGASGNSHITNIDIDDLVLSANVIGP